MAMQEVERYGFDVSFVEEIRDEYKCVFCCLVIRDPVQIMSCGHRFCARCFEAYKKHTEEQCNQLLCPVDREAVSPKDVLPDRGFGRSIGNLSVRCGNAELGCTWINDLRDLQNHEQSCAYRVIPDVEQLAVNDGGDDAVLQLILSKVEKCENELLNKDKEIVSLRACVDEMKVGMNMKDAEINALKLANRELQRQVESISTTLNEERKSTNHRLVALESAMLKANVPEEKVDSDNLAIKMLQTRVDKLESSSSVIEFYVLENMGSLKEKIEMIEAEQEESYQHIRNIENVLFTQKSLPQHDVEFEWVMQDYENLHRIGEEVYSPVFHTSVDGYCCRLRIDWTGKKKGKVGLYLYLSKSRDLIGELKPFNREYTLALQKNRGGSESSRISFQALQDNKDDYFTLNNEGKTDGYGFDADAPSHHFVINNSLFVSCTIHF